MVILLAGLPTTDTGPTVLNEKRPQLELSHTDWRTANPSFSNTGPRRKFSIR